MPIIHVRVDSASKGAARIWQNYEQGKKMEKYFKVETYSVKNRTLILDHILTCRGYGNCLDTAFLSAEPGELNPP